MRWPLFRRLAGIRAGMPADVLAAYDAFLATLDAAGVSAQVLPEGAACPDFLLPRAEGGLVSRDDKLAHGPLVLTFFRGAWCPYCSETLDALEEALPDIVAAGASLVGLTPETGGRALAMKQAHTLSYDVLIDVDLAVGMAFGVVFRTPPAYEAVLRSRKVDLPERSGSPTSWLPIPATFLIDRRGRIARRWVDIDFTRRPEPDEILAAIRAM